MAKATQMLCRQFAFGIVAAIVCCLGPLPILSAQAAADSPARRMQEMFDAMADASGPMAPFFGRLSDAQQRQIDAIPVSRFEEDRFGRRVLTSFLQQLAERDIAVARDGRDVAYVQKLVDMIRPRLKNAQRYRQIQVYVIDVPQPDAYSIPGGHVVITRGLLETGESEAAIVGVLAHELSHLDRGHQLTSIKASKLSGRPMNFEDGMLWTSLIARPVRPEDETEADADATRWMARLGYSPRELVRLLERWDQQQNQTMPWQEFVPGFIKSHPDAGRRARAVAQLADQEAIQGAAAAYIGADNLRLRVTRQERRFR
jgi:predicted Zn-dependent protease